METFNFNNQEIRSLTLDNEPFFIGKDIASVLGYTNVHKAIRDHVYSEDKRTERIVHPVGGTHETIIINESGLYSLILKSKLPTAKKFKRWVTSEVLPTIRKHGMYATADTVDKLINDPDTAIRLLETIKEEREKRVFLEQQVAEYEPKVSYLDTILSSTDTVTVTQIAADYGLSAKAMNKLLNELGVQHKVGGQWILYRKHMQQGYTKSHTSEIPKADGGVKVVMNTKWSQKGRLFLYNLLSEEGYYPQMDMEA